MKSNKAVSGGEVSGVGSGSYGMRGMCCLNYLGFLFEFPISIKVASIIDYIMIPSSSHALLLYSHY